MKLKVYTDGGSRGNPGPAGIGVAIFSDNNQAVQEYGEYIGNATNNVAEYKAVIKGLQIAKQLGATEVEIIADSELMVKQMTGVYKVKNENLQPLYRQVRAEMQDLKGVTFRHVKRELNKDADRMANLAMDKRSSVEHNFGTEKVEQQTAPQPEVVAVGEQSMLVKAFLIPGSVVAEQSSLSEQAVYVLEGKISYSSGVTKSILSSGEGIIIPPAVEYRLEAWESTVLLHTKHKKGPTDKGQ